MPLEPLRKNKPYSSGETDRYGKLWLAPQASQYDDRVGGALPTACELSYEEGLSFINPIPHRAESMPTLISKSTIIQAAGNKPKIIEEFIGRVNSKDSALSIAKMKSPSGWVEPGQTPQFDEYTVVLVGMLRVENQSGATDVMAGQAIITRAGEWVRYSTPGPDGAEYIAVCHPAFSPETVRRDSP